MPRFMTAKMQPLQTLFMQHTRKDDCFVSSGKGSEQIGQSSSSDLLRPFFISTSSFPAATHCMHRRELCLRPRCSSLCESSGSWRSHVPQIFMICWRRLLACNSRCLSLLCGRRGRKKRCDCRGTNALTKLKDKRHQHSDLSDHRVGEGGDACLKAFIVHPDSFCPKYLFGSFDRKTRRTI